MALDPTWIEMRCQRKITIGRKGRQANGSENDFFRTWLVRPHNERMPEPRHARANGGHSPIFFVSLSCLLIVSTSNRFHFWRLAARSVSRSRRYVLRVFCRISQLATRIECWWMIRTKFGLRMSNPTDGKLDRSLRYRYNTIRYSKVGQLNTGS
jgi:hypothetical protein